MKGGQTPIHIMRWAPSDYVNDPWVKLAASRNDTGALAFYHLFLFYSHLEGGSLPADPELLAAIIGLRSSMIKKALSYWGAPKCGLVIIKDGRAWNPRVARDVAAGLEFRGEQQVRGQKGGRVSAAKRSLERSLERVVERPSSPPLPLPKPTPEPTTDPPLPPAGAGGNGDHPGTAEAVVYEGAKRHAVSAGYVLSREDRRFLRGLAEGGATLESLKESIDQAKARGQPTLKPPRL